jgi:predicted pyridoxine 5'-phosphate oxidase superfamily flavin-nucleotide-binding protein
MPKLTQEMKDLIGAQQCFVATVNPDGTPNIGPKRSTRVLDDEHIAFNEVTANQTWKNVQNGSKVAIAVADREKLKGFRFTGTPEAVSSGPVFEASVAAAQKAGMRPPIAVIRVKLEHIFNLGIPGAGQEIV